jgi:hypothetical protein
MDAREAVDGPSYGRSSGTYSTIASLTVKSLTWNLQAQLEEMRKMWEEEHNAKLGLEAELHRLQADIQALQGGKNDDSSRKRARMD